MYNQPMGVPLQRHGQGVLSSISVADENDQTEQATNILGRKVKPQVLRNQPNAYTQTSNVYRQKVGGNDLRQSTPPNIYERVTTPIRQNVGEASQRQPQPSPVVIHHHINPTRQIVGERAQNTKVIHTINRQQVGEDSCSSFLSFIGVLISTICVLAFCILLNPK
ncbi:MAG: hypothetical protein H0T62_08245 [Parachlamydiaceae bacterium]|nr:hypothetical protein [Parachlamydiaceae bacterium]